eukprot:scaffold3383_cov129-Skeletonema_dohrnii-CCMP3373.AAC.5
MNKQHIRFAPTCTVVVVDDRTKGIIKDKLWYSSDDVDQFKLYSSLYAEAIKEKIYQGSFDGEIGDILGLEKLLCGKSYFARRAILKAAVLEEQAFQRLVREMRLRRGLGDVDSHGENANASIATLANVAEENSRWARECASAIGLALQSDLCADIVAEAEAEQRPIHEDADDDVKTSFNSYKRPYEAEAEETSFASGGATSLAMMGRPCHRGRCHMRNMVI